MKDAYQILGIKKTATAAEIKSAYRKLARQYHPDLKPGDKAAEDMFKEISAAYDILSDPEKKRRYDSGETDMNGNQKAGFSYRQYGGGPGGQEGFQHHGFDFGADFDLGDIFSSFGFGPGGRRGKSRQQDYSSFRGTRANGTNSTYHLTIPFIEAALGTSREIGLMGGRKVKLAIPAGTTDGAVLRLKGQGMAGTGGGADGDALINIKVQPHPFFERKGGNIHMDVPVTLREAVLGAKINIPTLDGMVSVNIPKNSSSGAVLRLKGKGIPKEGDLLIRLNIVLPEKNDRKLEEFVENNPEGFDFDPRKKIGMT